MGAVLSHPVEPGDPRERESERVGDRETYMERERTETEREREREREREKGRGSHSRQVHFNSARFIAECQVEGTYTEIQ